MGARPLTTLGLQMLATLPPRLQGSNDYQGVIHACAREFEQNLEPAVEAVRSQFNPATSDVMLNAWEYIVKLPVGGGGASIVQRQQKVLQRLRKQLGASEGREWEASVTDLVGGGWSYEEHIPGDGTSPPANTLRITLPFPPDGSKYAEALIQIREFTAAHLEIEFAGTGGFLLDESELDLEELTY